MADTAAAGVPADSTRVVLVGGPLRIRPAGDGAAVADIAAGTVLREVGDTTIGSTPWVRLATWDDRKGWMPRSAVLQAGLWAHYSDALGGVAVISLRPAYPIGEGRWAAEAPYPSPDFMPSAAAWLAGDSLIHARVTERDTMTVECTGARYPLAVLDRADRAGTRRGVRLEEGALALPASGEPKGRAFPVAPLEPDEGLLRAVEGAVRAAVEAGPAGEIPEDAEAPPVVDAGPRLDWRGLGPDAAWAVAYWNPFEGREAEIMPGRWGAAFLAVRDGSGWSVQTVVPLDWAFVGSESPPWRLLAAVATVPGRPTLLAVEAVEYEGARVDLYLADDTGYRRFYRGFYWGC